jgi:hypothetical protein
MGTGPLAKLALAAGPGDFVVINYIAYLRDGTIFDNTVKRGKPVAFQVALPPPAPRPPPPAPLLLCPPVACRTERRCAHGVCWCSGRSARSRWCQDWKGAS